MGQLIDFYFNNVSQETRKIHNTSTLDLLEMIPNLRAIANKNVVIKIHYEDIYDESNLYRIIKEVAILKQLDINPIIVLDFDHGIQFNSFNELRYIEAKNKFDNLQDYTTFIKSVTNTILAAISNLYGTGLVLSGAELKINVDIPSKLDEQCLRDEARYIFNINDTAKSNTKHDKFTNIINELNKTKLIPVVLPVCEDQNGNNIILESNTFVTLLSKYINISKIILHHRITADCLEKSIYNVYYIDQYIQDLSEENQQLKDLLLPIINLVKSNPSDVYLVRSDLYSTIEELCLLSPRGLMIYNDLDTIEDL